MSNVTAQKLKKCLANVLLQSLQFNFNCRTFDIIHIFCSKHPMTSYVCSLVLAPKQLLLSNSHKYLGSSYLDVTFYCNKTQIQCLQQPPTVSLRSIKTTPRILSKEKFSRIIQQTHQIDKCHLYLKLKQDITKLLLIFTRNKHLQGNKTK